MWIRLKCAGTLCTTTLGQNGMRRRPALTPLLSLTLSEDRLCHSANDVVLIVLNFSRLSLFGGEMVMKHVKLKPCLKM